MTRTYREFSFVVRHENVYEQQLVKQVAHIMMRSYLGLVCIIVQDSSI